MKRVELPFKARTLWLVALGVMLVANAFFFADAEVWSGSTPLRNILAYALCWNAIVVLNLFAMWYFIHVHKLMAAGRIP